MEKAEKEQLLIEIKEFYNRVISETVELTRTYNCKTPLEIYCLFNLINKNYIKKNAVLSMQNDPFFTPDLEKEDIMGLYVLLNGGLCRHRSAMLNDIYHKMGIDSVTIYGYLENLITFYYGNSKDKWEKDRSYIEKLLEKRSKGLVTSDKFENLLEKRNISYEIKYINDDYFKKQKKMLNHVIVMAGEDKKYYLDPMNNITFHKNSYEEMETLRSCIGECFYPSISLSAFIWGCWLGFGQEKLDTYNKIIQLPNDIESETLENIKDIHSHLKQYSSDIKEFAKSHSKSIEGIKKKSLTLPVYPKLLS